RLALGQRARLQLVLLAHLLAGRRLEEQIAGVDEDQLWILRAQLADQRRCARQAAELIRRAPAGHDLPADGGREDQRDPARAGAVPGRRIARAAGQERSRKQDEGLHARQLNGTCWARSTSQQGPRRPSTPGRWCRLGTSRLWANRRSRGCYPCRYKGW